MAHRDSFVQFVDSVNRSGGTYHHMDFGGGLVMDGEYDMARYLEHYRLPENLRGKRVLDVGTASGFFAFECARRGANVTAIDLHEADLFEAVREGLGLDATYLRKTLFELDSDFGSFDLVVCGSVLLHLSDPLEALRRIRSVCRERVIVATAVKQRLGWPGRRRAVCEFVGERSEGGAGEYWTYWMPNMAALVRMLKVAGFSRVEEIGRFTLCSKRDKHGFATPHGVVHGEV